MTDTRKYIEEQFDQFFEFETSDRSTVTSASCRFFVEHCIEQLLAVIELQRHALQSGVDCGMVPISSAKEGGAARYSQQVIVADKIREALALQPADVELVESGYLDEFDNFEKSIKPWMQEEPNVTWQPVYTIKTKANK